MDNIGAPPMFSSNNVFGPLLIAMAGIACASIVMFLYHFFLLKYCRQRRQISSLNGVAIGVPDGHHLTVGLDPKLIETIPTMEYSEARKCDGFRDDHLECVVCLGELDDGDVVRLLPNCHHAFHVPCIDRWFVAHCNCPVCRAPLTAFLDDKCDEKDCQEIATNVRDDLERNCDENKGDSSSSSSSSSSSTSSGQMHSCGLLRQCTSVMLPMEKKSSLKGLRRSLSLDQSFVIIEMPMEEDDDDVRQNSLSKSKDLIVRSKSIRQFDIVSSRLLVSLSSPFRMHKGREILLPY